MSTGFLSAPVVPIQFGSVTPEMLASIVDQGLKDRATFGGQIVTAIKMAWWYGCAPYRAGCYCLVKILALLAGIMHCLVSVFREARHQIADCVTMCGVVLNKRMRVALAACTLWAFINLGVIGVVYVVVGVTGFILCYIPADAKFYIRLMEKMGRAWGEALSAKDLPEDMEFAPVKVKKHNKLACKLAIHAISKVGLLPATKANALVYQKVVLDEMRARNVRHADRVSVLPLAIVACLRRPDEVERVEGCIRHLYSQTTSL
nr:MAG: hypothetical protein [Tombusviridae sp.]